jgi:monothiol glutaredoxin, Grx4 family
MNAKQKIQNTIESNDVVLFMKGTPDMPQCGFSMAIANVLKILNIKFDGVNVLEDEGIRNEIKVFSDWPTIPQLYIKGEFIGGCDIVKEMFEKKELQALLDEKKLITKINYLE